MSLRDRDELVEAIAARQYEHEESPEPAIKTMEDAAARVLRDYPSFSDQDYAGLADLHIGRLVDAGVPVVDAVLRGSREVAERLGLAEREHDGVSDELKETSAVIEEMRQSRVGARAHE